MRVSRHPPSAKGRRPPNCDEQGQLRMGTSAGSGSPPLPITGSEQDNYPATGTVRWSHWAGSSKAPLPHSLIKRAAGSWALLEARESPWFGALAPWAPLP